jgi:hypothetical protein
MSNVELIKIAVERSTKAISLRPAIGQGAEMMSFDVDETGCCRVADGDEQIVIDLSEEYGGEGKTPSAGFFVRAALGAAWPKAIMSRPRVSGSPSAGSASSFTVTTICAVLSALMTLCRAVTPAFVTS